MSGRAHRSALALHRVGRHRPARRGDAPGPGRRSRRDRADRSRHPGRARRGPRAPCRTACPWSPAWNCPARLDGHSVHLLSYLADPGRPGARGGMPGDPATTGCAAARPWWRGSVSSAWRSAGSRWRRSRPAGAWAARTSPARWSRRGRSPAPRRGVRPGVDRRGRPGLREPVRAGPGPRDRAGPGQRRERSCWPTRARCPGAGGSPTRPSPPWPGPGWPASRWTIPITTRRNGPGSGLSPPAWAW